MTSWRRVLAAVLLALGGGAAKAKPPQSHSGSATHQPARAWMPRPDDKGVNEGGHGRINATEDAARDAESPYNARWP